MQRLLMYDPTYDALFGAQRTMLELATGLRDRGYEPVVATGREGPLSAAARELGLAVVILPIPERINVFGGGALRAPLGRKLLILTGVLHYAVRVWRYVRKSDIDVLHANDLRSVLFLSVCRVLLRKRLVWYIHGGPSFGILSVCAALLADRIVLISHAAEKALPARARMRVRGRTSVNYAGIDAALYTCTTSRDERARIRRRYGLPERDLLVTSIGSISPRKGFDTLVAALEVLHAKHGSIHVAIAGLPRGAGSDEFLPNLMARVERNGLPVSFLGWIEDVRDLLAASDVFVLASREEGLGRVILEAMATCLPVVVTYAGGSEETVIDGESGYIVQPDDPEKLAAALEPLLQDEALRARLGARARRRCEEVFSMESFVERFVDHALAGYADVAPSRVRRAG